MSFWEGLGYAIGAALGAMIPGVWQGIAPGLEKVGQSVVSWGVDQFGVQSPRIGSGMARMLDSTVGQIGGGAGQITGAQDRTGGQVAQGSGQIAGAQLGAGGQVAGAAVGAGGQVAGATIGGSSIEAGAQMAGSGQVAGATVQSGGLVAGAVDRVGPSIERASSGITIGAGRAVGGEVAAASPAVLAYRPGKPKGSGFFEQILVSTMEQALLRSPELTNIFMDQAKVHIVTKTIRPDMFKTDEVKKAVAEFLEKMKASPATMADFFMMLIELPGRIFTDVLYGILTPEPPLTLEKARRSQSRYVGIIFDVNVLVGIIDMVLEAVTLGQFEGMGRLMSNMIWSMGLGQVPQYTVAPLLERAVVRPLEYYFNQTLTPEIPREADLIEMATKRLITSREYHGAMGTRGFEAMWSDTMLQASWTIPGYGELREMVWRGAISLEGLDTSLRLSGVHEAFIPGYEELTKRIPGPGDLITMVIREVITPEDFAVYMPMQGFYDPWPGYYWEMHWILLPLGEVKAARHRGHIDDDELGKFLVLHDYKPEPRPGIKTSDRDLAAKLIWELPGRIEARWMFRWGRIDVEGLRDLLIKGGLDPEYAGATAEAVAMNQFLREIRLQETNIKTDLSTGYIVEDTARADLTELGYPEPFVEYHIKDALSDRERKHKKALLDYYKDAYLKDMATEPPFEDAVREILVVPESADDFINDAYLQKYKKTPPVPDLTERLAKAKADLKAQQARVDRLREDVTEYEASISEEGQVFDARIAAVEAQLAIETRSEQIRKLDSQLRILRAQKEAKLTAMADTLSSKQRSVLEAEIKLDYLAEMVKLLEEKAKG